MRIFVCLSLFVLLGIVPAFGQLSLPPESSRQDISQMVGDTKVAIGYFRPNVKGRVIWGCETQDVLPRGGVTYPCLVPNGQVWRTGANDATSFEVSNDVTINGQKLPKGKYGLYTIPGQSEWTVIFNKAENQWGSFRYDDKQDVIRVKAKPVASEFLETMTISVDSVAADSAVVTIRWEKIAVPFTLSVGDVNARIVNDMRRRMSSEPVQIANYVINKKLADYYPDALNWLDAAIKTRETWGNLQARARLLAEMGRFAEAVTAGEKALAFAKTMQQAPNTADLERRLAEWKTKK